MRSVGPVLAPGRPPSMSLRHTAGAINARALLFTVLGEFVLPGDGSAWTSAFIDVLGRMGVEEKATRQALARTAADGWLTSVRVGRRTRWQLTGAAERLLTEGTERIYGFSAVCADWDGSWLLVLARVPESDRPARHLLRTRLARAGMGSPSPGVWLSTHPDRRAEVERVLSEVGALPDAQIFLARQDGGGDLAGLVRQAWDLDALEQDYERFLTSYETSPDGDRLAQLTGLVHTWRRFPWIDPELPRELLPPRWSGTQAAARFTCRHAEWAPEANAAWQRISAIP